MSRQAWILLVVLSILWGGSFLFVALALDAYPPLSIVAFRVATAAIVLHLVIITVGARWPTGTDFLFAIAIMGLLNNVIPFALIAWGQIHVASGLASVFNAMTPIFTLLVAHWLTADEKLTARKIWGASLGFVGVVVLIGYESLQGLGNNIIGQLAIIAATISYAFAGVWAKKRLAGHQPLHLAAGQVTASALILGVMAMLVDGPVLITQPDVPAYIWMTIMGVLSTALAYLLYFRILAIAGASNLLLVTFLIPISAIAAGALVLGERLEIQHLLGIVMIALGLALIDGRVVAHFSSRPRR